MRWSDKFFYLFVAVGAFLLALFGFCIADWAFAAVTILLTMLWAWLLYCRIRNSDHYNSQ